MQFLIALLLIQFSLIDLTISSNVFQFEYYGNSHYDFGLKMGIHFKNHIHRRFNSSMQLQQVLIPFYNTQEGKTVYDEFLQIHTKYFKDYVEELKGIADGSGMPFEYIFLMNLKEEITKSKAKTLHCSDVIIRNEIVNIVGHNEDSDISDLGNTALVTAQINSEPKFTAFTYLGDLPTGGFGYNEYGLAFTLNYVQPAEVLVGGIGRGFISRDLLYAVNISDAVRRISKPNQSVGHNYQLLSIREQRILNVEVASFGRYGIREFHPDDIPFFHANQYQLLQINQKLYASSTRRLARVSTFDPPNDIDDALFILGDQYDKQYPVYHDKFSHNQGDLSSWTMITVVFDITKEVALLYEENPKFNNYTMKMDLGEPGRYIK